MSEDKYKVGFYRGGVEKVLLDTIYTEEEAKRQVNKAKKAESTPHPRTGATSYSGWFYEKVE